MPSRRKTPARRAASASPARSKKAPASCGARSATPPSSPKLRPAPKKLRESRDARRARALAICDLLQREYPEAHCSLDHRDPFELLVATILSAQCTDARVNMVTPALFRRAPDAAALAAVPPAELESLIQSTGFFRNKAKSLLGAARKIVDEHGGEVPRTMDALLELPGVARKTANVVMGNAYGVASGVVVDTHVHRISRLLALTANDDPKKIEQDLIELLPADRWIQLPHEIIEHGRKVCIANRPKCDACVLNRLCPSSRA